MPSHRSWILGWPIALLFAGCLESSEPRTAEDGATPTSDGSTHDGGTPYDASDGEGGLLDAAQDGSLDAASDDASAGDSGSPKDAILPDLTATWDDVRPILQQKCSTGLFCHGNWTGNYDALQAIVDKPICNYEGRFLERYDCSLRLIEAGGMPRSRGCVGDPYLDEGRAGCLTVEELASFRGWVAMGAPR